MNVKEIAQAVGKTERTVHNWIERVSEKIAQVSEKIAQARATSKPADYTLDETIAIIEHGMGKNAAALFRMNADNKPKEIDRLDRLEKLVENLVVIVTQNIIQNNTNRVKQIESVPQISTRNRLNQIIRTHCEKTEEPYGMVWGRLYNAIYYRLGINVVLRAKNQNITAIEYIDQNNILDKVITIADEMFG